jgi:1-acyl-sn-glycerol-3-phosphate acyltransferase
MKPLYQLCHTLSGTIAKVVFQYRAYGQENIIEEGPAIMAANHQSYLDPPLVGITCRNELYFLARKTLFEKKLLGPLISRVNALPVDLSRGDFSGGNPVVNRADPASATWDRHDHRQDACACRPDANLWIV